MNTISFKLKQKDLNSNNIVCFLRSSEDVEILSFLGIESHIISDIHSLFIKKDFQAKEYFLPHIKHTKIFVFVSQEDNYKKNVEFLGKYLPKLPEDLALISNDTKSLEILFETCVLSRYSFQNYKTEKKLQLTEVLVDGQQKKILQEKLKTLENIFLARDLGETPAHDLTPSIFAQKVKNTKFKYTKVKVLSFKDIQKKGLGLIEAVGKGSENKPCMVILEYIRNKKKPILGLVGKGITFDTGGNQLKPGDHMYEMKGDMGGAAVTYALMKELDRHNVDKNIVACLVLAENVVSSNAYKPSDIITGYTGKTVEIIHTDAEGRLVLADGMSYLGKNYKTSSMMTIATLTGACMVALGYRYAGVMGTDESMIDSILEYSKTHTEKYVKLPFDEYFQEKTKSTIADFKNLDRAVLAGSSMGAAFLSNFLENNETYTHIDIAGTYINEGEAYGKMPKGMTGFGVESLSHILKNS